MTKLHYLQDPHEAWSPNINNTTWHSYTANKTSKKHGQWLATIIHNIHALSTKPAWSMIATQEQHNTTYMCCQQDLHKTWFPDNDNITRYTYTHSCKKHSINIILMTSFNSISYKCFLFTQNFLTDDLCITPMTYFYSNSFRRFLSIPNYFTSDLCKNN